MFRQMTLLPHLMRELRYHSRESDTFSQYLATFELCNLNDTETVLFLLTTEEKQSLPNKCKVGKFG